MTPEIRRLTAARDGWPNPGVNNTVIVRRSDLAALLAASPVLIQEDTQEEDLSRVDRQSPSIGQELPRSPQRDSSRRRVLADYGASIQHEWYFDAAANIDDVPPDGHVQPYETCPQADCALVRRWTGAVSAEDCAVDRVAAERPQEPLRAHPLDSLTLLPLLLQEDTNELICHQCGKPYPCQAQP